MRERVCRSLRSVTLGIAQVSNTSLASKCVAARRSVWRMSCKPLVRDSCFYPDNRNLVSVHVDHETLIRNVSSGKIDRRLEGNQPELAVTPDGSGVIVGGRDGATPVVYLPNVGPGQKAIYPVNLAFASMTLQRLGQIGRQKKN